MPHTTAQEIKCIMTLKAFFEEAFSVSKQSHYQVFSPAVAHIYIVKRYEMYADERLFDASKRILKMY